MLDKLKQCLLIHLFQLTKKVSDKFLLVYKHGFHQ